MTLGTAVLLLALGAAPVQQPARDVPVKPAPGTGVISGVVLIGSAGEAPARRSRVVLTTANPLGGHSVIADDAGRFAFTNLPAGRYTLAVRRDGFITTTYGARRPGGAGTMLVIAAGQRLDGLVVRIPKGAAVTGTLADRHGDRAADARVTLYRVRTVDGERRLEQAGTATADDRGVYRVHSLPAGEYLVAAAAPLRGGDSGLRQMTERDWQAALQPPRSGGGVSPITPASAMLPATAAPPPSPALVSAPVFYPGTLMASQAFPVIVDTGEERAGVDFAVQLVPAAKIDGQVIDPSGRSDMAVTVTINSTSPMNVTQPRTLSVRMADQNGRFSLTSVPPGEYTIHAQGRVPAPGAAAAPPVILWGRTDVLVSGDDVSGIAILLQPALTLTGRVVLQRTKPARPNDTAGIRVFLENFAPPSVGSPQRQSTVSAAADGRFTLPGVGPGRYRLTAAIGGAAGAEWFLKSAVVNGRDAKDVPVDISPGDSVGDVVITLSDRGAELTGQLLDTAGRPAPGYFVVVLAADRSLWLRGSRRQTSVRPASDGQFSVRNLPPGEYLVAAVTDMETADLADTSFLETLVPGALKVSLAEGDRKVQNLRVGG